MRKQARNLIKIENDFGSVVYDNVEFLMKSAYFRFPSEHKVNGERLPMEFQLIGSSSIGTKIGLSVVFTVGDQVNYFLNELDFGKGYLKELPVSTETNSKFYTVNTHVSFDRLFTNNGSWIMYSGSDTNVPCDAITWLLSYDVVEVHKEQLFDIPEDVAPYFSIKSIGSRSIFRNTQNDEAKLDDIKNAEKTSNAGLKQMYKDDLKKEDQRLKNVLSNAVENAQEAENAAITSAKQKIEQEKQKEKDKVVAQIKEARKKHKLEKEKLKEKQSQADNKYPSTMLYERILDKMFAFNYVPPPCPDFSFYEPPPNKVWGYVPANMVMTWEISSYIGIPKVEIASPQPPKPLEKDLVYRPFYFKEKPKCQAAPNFSEPLLDMMMHPPSLNQNNGSTIKNLAQIDMSILNKTKEQLVEIKRLIPVYVKTSPNYSVPTFPTTIFYMLNGTNISSLPNTTSSNSAASSGLNTSVGLGPVVIRKEFLEDSIGNKALSAKMKQLVVIDPSKNGGYSLPNRLVPPLPNILNVTLPNATNYMKIWPALKSNFSEGTIPIDAKFPWNPIKESDLVINLDPPLTVHQDYRWILFFWIETPYTVGNNSRTAWIPIYILAHAEFSWTKNEIPSEIPVPKNLSKYQNGSLPVEFLPVKIEPINASVMVDDPNLLKLPKSVNPDELLDEPNSFRLKLVKRLNVENPLYAQLLENKYQKMPGMLGDLLIKRQEEETGMMIEEDIPWRIDRRTAELARIEKERLQQQEKSKDNSTRPIRYRRVCVDYNLEAILNKRSLSGVDGIFTNSYFTCRNWRWEEDTEVINNSPNGTKGDNGVNPPSGGSGGQNNQNGTSKNPSGGSSGTNSSSGSGGTGGEGDGSSSPLELEDAAKKEKEIKCREYLKIILNRRKLFFSEVRNDVLDKECEETFTRMRQERLETFKGGFGPALKIAKDVGEKSGQIIKGVAKEVNDNLKKAKINLDYTLP